MTSAIRSQALITPTELLAFGEPYRLLDARAGSAKSAYQQRHLHGAVFIDLETALAGHVHDPAHGGRHPLPALRDWSATLGAAGIKPTDWVFIYDDQSAAMAAARCWWMLKSIGHDKVRVIDGGLQAADAAGMVANADAVAIADTGPYPVKQWLLPLAVREEVHIRATDANWTVIDVRAAERYRGEVEPIDPKAGHIAGVRNLPYTQNLKADGHFKSSDELYAMYNAFLDGCSPERLIVHCGSGVTACHTLLALEHAGLHGAALYVGSWSEWCRSMP